MPTIDEVVSAYIACGKATGYLNAETILMNHLPKNMPEGKCYDVPEKNRAALLAELKEAIENSKKEEESV
jgi:hypothetical protein